MTLLKYILFIIISFSVVFIANGEDDFAKYNQRGVELGKKGKIKEALIELNKGRELYDKRSAKVLHNQGWILELGGKHKEAIKKYEKATKRFPDLIHTHERLGFCYYKTGDYENAIKEGEFVLKKDPSNREVKKWLYDAYRLKQSSDVKSSVKESSNSIKEIKKEAKKEANKTKKDYKFFASLDYTYVSGLYYEGENTWNRYIMTNGLVVNAPYTLKAYYTPNSWIGIDFETGNPYLGAGLPHVVSQYEKMEFYFDLKYIIVGVGVLANHYKDDFVHGEEKRINDVKPGIILGFRGEFNEFILSAYPRYYPRDTSSSKGDTLDADYFKISYSYIFDNALRYFSKIEIADYYFTDNDLEVSSFWGYYEIAIGMRLGGKGLITGRDFGLTIELAKRINLELLNSTRPYKQFNGQGYLGYNKDPGDTEERFSFKSASSILRVMFEESLSDNSFAYQKIIMELADRHSDHDEYALQIGFGLKY